MDWKRLAGQAKQVIDKRGGTQALKEDAEELKDIAQEESSSSEKLSEAARAIKEPGAHHQEGQNETTP